MFADTLYKTTGVTHHELPAYAITMMVPLLEMTPAHGPTQFSMGSSNLAGMTEDRDATPLRDESLRKHLYDQPDLGEDEDDADYKYMRTPLVGFGDILLFDYQIIHRGLFGTCSHPSTNSETSHFLVVVVVAAAAAAAAAVFFPGGKNVSPDLRAILYLTYSRFWYKDKGFEDEEEDDYDVNDTEEVKQEKFARQLYKQLTSSARFAVPDEFEENDDYDDVRDADWKEYGDGPGGLGLEGLHTFENPLGAKKFHQTTREEL